MKARRSKKRRPGLLVSSMQEYLKARPRDMDATDVIFFVVTNCPRLNPGAAGLTVTALRSLLGFLYVDGAIDRSLVSAVLTTPPNPIVEPIHAKAMPVMLTTEVNTMFGYGRHGMRPRRDSDRWPMPT